MKKYNRLLGVDIGSKTLKIADIKKGKLIGFVYETLPDNIVVDGSLVAFEAMADFLKDVLKKHKISTKTVALILPDTTVYTRRLTMPAMNEKQLKTNLPYEFNGLLAGDKDKYLYDYSIIGYVKDEDDEIREMEMLGAVVNEELLNKYADMFRRAGLKMVKAGPCETALSALIFNLREAGNFNDIALLDLGYHATKIQFFEQGRFEVDRTIETGLADIEKIVAETFDIEPYIASTYLKSNKEDIQNNEKCVEIYTNIATEIMRVINFYHYEHQNSTLETLYYCGGGSKINRFLSEIADQLPINLAPLSDLGKIKDEAVVLGPAAIGTCVE